MLFRSRKQRVHGGGGPAVVEPPPENLEDLLAEIDRLSAIPGDSLGAEPARRLLSLRHQAGLAMLEQAAPNATHPAPDLDRFTAGAGVPEVGRDEVSPELLRAAILSRGCLLIRGLIDPEEAAAFRDEMDRGFAARNAASTTAATGDGYFEEFVPDPRYDLAPHRGMVSDPNGMWVADSPRVAAELLDVLGRAGFLELAGAYLGERPAFSVNKSTLRRVKADPTADYYNSSFWHQDGAFLGEVRALNLWLSLSRCGDVAPGLDLVPRRLDHIVPTGTEGATFDWSVSQTVAEQSAADAGIRRPVFEPGDALLFDELFLHATALSPEMTQARYAVECWFFGPSAFPVEYPPLAS